MLANILTSHETVVLWKILEKFMGNKTFKGHKLERQVDLGSDAISILFWLWDIR